MSRKLGDERVEELIRVTLKWTPFFGPQGVAVQVGRGLELKVDLTSQDRWAHHVHIQTFDGPLALFLSAANVVHVSVEGAPG